MSQLLKDKVALITGAANGIGAHFTEMFLAQGANVLLAIFKPVIYKQNIRAMPSVQS
jgi:NADP-dependent 3-hydroxy acid dehydrogenase YdfG